MRNGVAVAAGIDDEIANLRLRAGSAQRTIQRDMAGLLQDGFEAKLVGDAERREFDHNPRGLAGIGDFPRDILDGCGPGKAGHDDRRVARDLSGVVGDRDVGLRKLGASRGVGIEADHAPSALDEVAGDRASHDAKADNSNGLVHESCFLAIEFGLTGNAGRALIGDRVINNHQVACQVGQARAFEQRISGRLMGEAQLEQCVIRR